MKTVSGNLAASLAAGATTLCRCWLVIRADGTRMGFTDHDDDVAYAGDTYRAASGFTASSVDARLGLQVDGMEIAGVLSSASITEEDIARGLYDNASLYIFVVDWNDPTSALMLLAGSIGELTRGRVAFQAEARGLAHALNQPTGRLYQRTCDAVLGDARCGIAAAAWTKAGTVTTVYSQRRFAATGDAASAVTDMYTRGKLTWTSGANAGAVIEVKSHTVSGGVVLFDLWEKQPLTIAAGDAFSVLAGCDKTWSACGTKFNNRPNFRGFPHMPGNDKISKVAG